MIGSICPRSPKTPKNRSSKQSNGLEGRLTDARICRNTSTPASASAICPIIPTYQLPNRAKTATCRNPSTAARAKTHRSLSGSIMQRVRVRLKITTDGLKTFCPKQLTTSRMQRRTRRHQSSIRLAANRTIVTVETNHSSMRLTSSTTPTRPNTKSSNPNTTTSR